MIIFKPKMRVRYIGSTWPERRGWEGEVVSAARATDADDHLVEVQFDDWPRNAIVAYATSLELVE